MNATVFCGSCGASMNEDARFCPSCGASQEGFVSQTGAASTEPPVPPRSERDAPRGQQFADRVEAIDPGAGAFASQLAAGVQTPGVLTALASAALGALACFAVGLLLAIALPDESVIGGLGTIVSLVTEAFGQTVGLLLASFGVGGQDGRVAPLLLVAVPIGACALATASRAGATRALAPRVRLVWGAAVGLPFGLLMLVAAVSTGDLDASVGGSFLLGLVWGALGGLLGMAAVIRREAPESRHELQLPLQTRQPVALLTAALKPLVALLAITAVVGTGAWWLASIRDHDTARLTRSLPIALVENTLYAGEHAVNYAALGGGVQFRTGEALSPVPVNAGDQPIDTRFRVVDLGDQMEPYFFVPLLLLLLLPPVVLALYGGFAVARVSASRHPGAAAAWGALVGPVWAIALALLNAMHVDLLGNPDSDSLFGIFLLGGAVLGALGGLLASQSAEAAPRA